MVQLRHVITYYRGIANNALCCDVIVSSAASRERLAILFSILFGRVPAICGVSSSWPIPSFSHTVPSAP